MREKNIKNSDIAVTYCAMNQYTENPSDIKLPIFIHSEITDAQTKAIAPNFRSPNAQDGYVYRISVSGATYEEISQKLSILVSGEISIQEIVHVTRNEDGTPQRVARTSI